MVGTTVATGEGSGVEAGVTDGAGVATRVSSLGRVVLKPLQDARQQISSPKSNVRFVIDTSAGRKRPGSP